MKKFEFLPHTADIKIKAYGDTLNEIFENSVLAFSSYVSGEEKIKSTKSKIINVSGNDKESLLYNFLEELIYLLDAEEYLVSKAKVTLRGNNLIAEIFGDNSSNYNSLDHVKAATYSEMYVKKTPKGWEAQFVLDV